MTQPKAIWTRAFPAQVRKTKRELDRAGRAWTNRTIKPLPKRIRFRSKRETKRMKIYNRRRLDWLRGKFCAVYPALPAVCIHHSRGRTGKLLMAEQFWVATSLLGHQFIDANRSIARAKGWLCEKGLWNKQP